MYLEQVTHNGRYLGVAVIEDLDYEACFVCPNCDGKLSMQEHEQLGMCGDCYSPDLEH